MKQVRRKKLVAALIPALGAGMAFTAMSLDAAAQQAQKVERIEVTGSNIKRVDTETVAPVEIITREQIERTGQATVAEVLRNIPANTGGSYSEKPPTRWIKLCAKRADASTRGPREFVIAPLTETD